MARIRPALIALLLTALVGILAAVSDRNEARAQAPVAVAIAGFQFAPATLTVPVGTAVTWTNSDTAAHTTSGSGWDSGVLSQGQSFTFVTQSAGAFPYVCLIHPSMQGTLTVTGSAQATATPTPTAPPAPSATQSPPSPTASPSAVAATPTSSPTPSASLSPTAAPTDTQPPVVSTPAAAEEESDGGSSGVLIGGIVSVVLFSIGAGIMIIRRRAR